MAVVVAAEGWALSDELGHEDVCRSPWPAGGLEDKRYEVVLDPLRPRNLRIVIGLGLGPCPSTWQRNKKTVVKPE